MWESKGICPDFCEFSRKKRAGESNLPPGFSVLFQIAAGALAQGLRRVPAAQAAGNLRIAQAVHKAQREDLPRQADRRWISSSGRPVCSATSV